jgi:UDPglucose 6-dehydrogenase
MDRDEETVRRMREGHAALYEPGLDDALGKSLRAGTLQVSNDPSIIAGCEFIFIALDTPVGEDDKIDVGPVEDLLDVITPHLASGSIVILSSQVPVGTTARMRQRVRAHDPSVEVAYSPENLRLGQALRSYLEPGHIVIGAETPAAADSLEALFAPMRAQCFRMDLTSAELVKHCINSFLATSISLANHWSDLASVVGATYPAVVAAVRADPRIGERAYLDPGIGFSGGTLGRDLRVLDAVCEDELPGAAPLFGEIWRYNHQRAATIAKRIAGGVEQVGGRRVALLGLTYKPGTSTLRRSLPLELARRLLSAGIDVSAHDPRADWSEAAAPDRLEVAASVDDAVRNADLLVVLTPWPEYRTLDLRALAARMRQALVYDPALFFSDRSQDLADAGFQHLSMVRT